MSAGSELEYLAKYEGISEDVIEQVKEHTKRSHLHLASAVTHMLAVASSMLHVRDLLPFAAYKEWVTTEFGFTMRTAQRYVRVATAFAERNMLEYFIEKGLPPQTSKDALFIVTASAVPSEITSEAIARMYHESPLTRAVARELVETTTNFLETAEEAERYSPQVQQLVLASGIADPETLPGFERLTRQEPEALQVIAATGALEVATEEWNQRPLREVRPGDIDSFFKTAKKDSSLRQKLAERTFARLTIMLGDGSVNIEFFRPEKLDKMAGAAFSAKRLNDFREGRVQYLSDMDAEHVILLTPADHINTDYV